MKVFYLSSIYYFLANRNRRELIRANKLRSIRQLDELKSLRMLMRKDSRGSSRENELKITMSASFDRHISRLMNSL
jgi:hypothetical protein